MFSRGQGQAWNGVAEGDRKTGKESACGRLGASRIGCVDGIDSLLVGLNLLGARGWSPAILALEDAHAPRYDNIHAVSDVALFED